MRARRFFFVMVDMHYPLNLHDPHSDFPLASEKMSINNEFISSYQQKLNPKKELTKKLTVTLFHKRKLCLSLLNC